jgi:hypothetical protein
MRVHPIGPLSLYSLYAETNLIFVQIKWISPAAPTQPIAAFDGFPCTACEFLN